MTVTDLDIAELADQEALRLRRLELRAMADDIMAAMHAMPMPKTWLDAGRTLRALATADRTVTQLYLPPRRGRARPTKPPQPQPQPREDAGSIAEPKTNLRDAVVEKPTPHTSGGRPSKGARGRLNRSASTFATVTPVFEAHAPAQDTGTLPFATPPPPFRAGKPDGHRSVSLPEPED